MSVQILCCGTWVNISLIFLSMMWPFSLAPFPFFYIYIYLYFSTWVQSMRIFAPCGFNPQRYFRTHSFATNIDMNFIWLVVCAALLHANEAMFLITGAVCPVAILWGTNNISLTICSWPDYKNKKIQNISPHTSPRMRTQSSSSVMRVGSPYSQLVK